MKRSILIFTFAFILSLGSFAKGRITIKNANIIDIKTGKITKGQNIIIENDIIIDINSKSISKSKDQNIIDGTGKFVIPGLWDMHVHLYFPKKEYLKLYIANGVIGVREMSGRKLNWKDSIGNDPNVPIINYGSPIIDGENPWFDHVESVKYEDIDSTIKKYKDLSYDFIKILSLVNSDEYKSICEACKKYQIPLAGHVPYSTPILQAAKAGQISNEHLHDILLSCSSKEKEIRAKFIEAIKIGKKEVMKTMWKNKDTILNTFDEEKAISLIKKLSKFDMYQCPTLTVHKNFAWDECKFANEDGRQKYFPDWVNDKKPKTDSIPARIIYKRNELKLKMKVLKLMQEHGLKIIAGTDNGYAGYNLHDELKYLTEAGLTNIEALRTATTNAVKFLRIENKYGSIKKNMHASLLVLNSNPLENIDNTRDIDLVIFKNKIIHPENLKNSILKLKEEEKPNLAHILFSKSYEKGAVYLIDLCKTYQSDPKYKNEKWDEILIKLAYSFGHLKKYDDSKKMFYHIINNYPSNISAYFLLAEVLEKTGEIKDAIENYQKVLSLNSDNQKAKTKIEELKKLL
ncbi:MAG: amidohydrolase family protein [Marinifilaceae bacterium]|jgi:imidazolonepropionase-like amidohydrolase|nr:amidohydrolase family protein [Marinifilaceae bacterium]